MNIGANIGTTNRNICINKIHLGSTYKYIANAILNKGTTNKNIDTSN